MALFHMNRMRKGQFYLFTSLLLIIMLVGIIPLSSRSAEEEDVFSELVENFMTEARVAVNNALYHDANMTLALDGFVTDFLNYARSRDPNFGFVLALKNGDDVILINHLKETITVDSGTVFQMEPGNSSIVAAGEIIYVSIEQGIYKFEFKDHIQLKMLFKTSKGENIYIREAG